MEKIRNLLFKKKLQIFYPPDEIEKWKNLKNKHSRHGYKWLDLSLNPSLWKSKSYDRKNRRIYNKLKRKEEKLRRSFRGHGHIPYIIEPPSPNNEERYMIMKKWSVNNFYNISMISVYLYKKFNLDPCEDYEPDDIINTYNRYIQFDISDNFPKRSNSAPAPMAPTAPLFEDSQEAIDKFQTPPSYNDSSI
tara:strand:+ start:71 stop:643 length:573 start_codon:yes stop_codon:yes gene_type:complete